MLFPGAQDDACEADASLYQVLAEYGVFPEFLKVEFARVDVVFSSGSGGTDNPPAAVNDSGFTTTQNAALSIPASALL
jgi:hypothetical protein